MKKHLLTKVKNRTAHYRKANYLVRKENELIRESIKLTKRYAAILWAVLAFAFSSIILSGLGYYYQSLNVISKKMEQVTAEISETKDRAISDFYGVAIEIAMKDIEVPERRGNAVWNGLLKILNDENMKDKRKNDNELFQNVTKHYIKVVRNLKINEEIEHGDETYLGILWIYERLLHSRVPEVQNAVRSSISDLDHLRKILDLNATKIPKRQDTDYDNAKRYLLDKLEKPYPFSQK